MSGASKPITITHTQPSQTNRNSNTDLAQPSPTSILKYLCMRLGNIDQKGKNGSDASLRRRCAARRHSIQPNLSRTVCPSFCLSVCLSVCRAERARAPSQTAHRRCRAHRRQVMSETALAAAVPRRLARNQLHADSTIHAFPPAHASSHIRTCALSLPSLPCILRVKLSLYKPERPPL